MLRVRTNSLQLLQLRRIAYTFQSPFLAPFGKLAPPNAYPYVSINSDRTLRPLRILRKCRIPCYAF